MLKEKSCEICGKPFMPNGPKQKYCKELHYRKCPVCGKSYAEPNLDKFKSPPTTCSMECRVAKRTQTSILKYGMVAPGNNPEAREKAKKTMRDRYGVDYAQESKEIKQKSINTCRKRYGVDNPQQCKEIQKKTRATKCLNRYSGIKETPEQVQYIKRRQIHTEYGVDLLQNVVDNSVENGIKITKCLGRLKNKVSQPRVVNRNGKSGENSNHRTKILKDIEKRLNELGIDTKTNINVGNIEYDVQIKGADILLSMNSSHTEYTAELSKGISRWYHLKKTLLARKRGYRCIHLWDWDCVPKFIKSLTTAHIIYLSNPPEVISKDVATKFIQQYGLYDVTRNINNIAYIGVRYKTKLISLMGFKQIDPILNIWELVCIENRFNYKVYDGYQKIINEFIRQYNPSKIISYADFSKTNGESLESLGFHYVKFILPNKIWSKGRHAIIDSPKIIPEAMYMEHWLPIYNCGYLLYELDVCIPKILKISV